MTGSCQSSPGSRASPYCWIAANSWGHALRCGTTSDCAEAALNWGRCIFGSCAFNRASGRTCDEMNRKNLKELKKECDTRGFSFDLGPKDTTKLLNCSTGLAPASVNTLRTKPKRL